MELALKEAKVRPRLLAILVIALVAEVGTSWWRWVRAPTDTLRVWYEGSFVSYEIERLIPWVIILTIVNGIWLLIRSRSAFK